MQELADRIAGLLIPPRISIVQAKRLILETMGDGRPHPSVELVHLVSRAEGAEPLERAAQLQVDLASRDAVGNVGADHPAVASLRAEIVTREAIAELHAGGFLVAAGGPGDAGRADTRFHYTVPGLGDWVVVVAPGPAFPSDMLCLPHHLRSPDVWQLEPDTLLADLTTLGLDDRTERCLREALESYRRGVYLAAASLVGAATEGVWYAAGQRLRTLDAKVDGLVDGDRTAQLQSAVAGVLRSRLPKAQQWEADELSQHAGLMRRIRNYGVHPRDVRMPAWRFTSRRTAAAC